MAELRQGRTRRRQRVDVHRREDGDRQRDLGDGDDGEQVEVIMDADLGGPYEHLVLGHEEEVEQQHHQHRGEHEEDSVASGVQLAEIAPALMNKAVTTADPRARRNSGTEPVRGSYSRDHSENNPASGLSFDEMEKLRKVKKKEKKEKKQKKKKSKKKKQKSRNNHSSGSEEDQDSDEDEEGSTRKRGSRLGCCARIILSLSAFLVGLMFVVSPIVFVAGVRSGQVDRNLLDKMGVASFLEDAGILKKRPIAKPKLGFLAGIFSSPEASFAGDASAMQIKKSHQAQSRAQRHRQDGDGLGTTNGGRDPVAGAPDDDVVVDPNVLAVAQDWLVGMIERVQTNVKHHVLSAFASEDGKSDAGTEKNAGHQASASSASSDVLLTEEDADAVITVEQVQEELAALWKTQQEMFDVFRDQLSQVSIASVLSQHRAAPAMDDDEEDFGFEDDARSHRRSRKSSGSHVKAHTPHEVRKAIERQRAAEEMGRLKVRSSGPVLGVRDMLRGEGLPYDPQIPWASI